MSKLYYNFEYSARPMWRRLLLVCMKSALVALLLIDYFLRSLPGYGYAANGGSPTCTQCQTNSFSIGASNACQSCPANFVSVTGSAACTYSP